MKIFRNALYRRHDARLEMYRGRLVPCHETPARLDHVLAELARRPVGALHDPVPDDAGLDAALAAIHAPRYLDFLAGAWDEWVALDPANAGTDILPAVWPVRGFRADVLPESFAARIGLFSFDAGSPVMAGTWAAAREGAACARSAALAVSGGRARRLRADPPARPPRRAGLLRRLLLPQQRRAGGADAARPRRGSGGGARCRLPPRQRHADPLLRPR